MRVPGRWKRPGIQSGNLEQVRPHIELVLTCHDRSPLSSPARRRAWIFMARRSFVNGLALDATRCSGSAGTVIADSAIAVPRAAPKPGAGSVAAPTTVISEAPKGSSIIVTDSADTAVVAPA
jgi:hypothetical protein